MKKNIFNRLYVLTISAYGQNKIVQIAYRLKEKDLIPEGLVNDNVSHTFFICDIYKKKIVTMMVMAKSGILS